ncbi:MAG: hypothetical protein A4E19_14105 [Nitrospira sp. SG-bin1]|nr:MAG: hypothetical protein A4E19_14105 [Nitrospira sp. SG-bin1]
MKFKTAVVGFACVALCSQAGIGLAAWGDGPGCGLGKMLFDREPKSIIMQHLGSTSNVPSQPFAISSGTSGCTNNGMIVKEDRATVFASINFDHLAQEMAQGYGEHLVSLATLLGVSAERQPEFFSLAQDRYLSLMRAGDASPKAMLEALQAAMAGRSILAQASTNR